MKNPKFSKGQFLSANHLEGDLRLEVIANEMINLGVDLDQILVSPMGGFFRGYRKDAAEINVLEDNLGGILYHQIVTSRDGVYDAIPENIFHDNIEEVLSGKNVDPIENVKRNREEEAAARKFFQIVEKEIYRLKILFEQEERKSIMGSAQFYKHDIFLKLWNELEELDAQYLPPLMQILPLACKYHGNLQVMAVFLEFLLEVDVSIDVQFEESTPIFVNQPCSLGHSWLGHTSVLGQCYYDFEPCFNIHIGPLTSSELELYMHKGKAAAALEVFCDYFFSLNSTINLKYFMLKTQNTVVLNSNFTKIEFDTRLGISSFL